MEKLYTPAPWAVNSAFKQEVNGHYGVAIADCSKSVMITNEEKEANAHLIASAPELLEALLWIRSNIAEAQICKYKFENYNAHEVSMQTVGQWREDANKWERVEAAIAKALNTKEEVK